MAGRAFLYRVMQRAAAARGAWVLPFCLLLGACAETPSAPDRPATTAAASGPQIVTPSRPLQCVPHARNLSRIQLRGDAWTWWASAKGRYARGSAPVPGSVLVLKRKGRSRGHLAVVTRVLNGREIVVEHANWLNEGRIHRNTPVRDVSPGNDWSAVRVWYTPGRVWGRSVYPAHGFIYPRPQTAAAE